MAHRAPSNIQNRQTNSQKNNLDNILPNFCAPLSRNLLADLQSGLEWNITTSPTKDGGYCIKFNTNKSKQTPQPNRSNAHMSGGKSGEKQQPVHKNLKIDQTPVHPSTSQQQCQDNSNLDMVYMCPEDAVNFAPSTAKSKTVNPPPKKTKSNKLKPEPAKEEVEEAVEEKEEQETKGDVNKSKSKQKTTPQIADDSGDMNQDMRFEEVTEALESQKNSGRPAMLVCVLLGSSLDLMRISDAVQDMATDRGVTVRMNAPMH